MSARRAAHDSILLIGFGGPTRPEEVRPFLDQVLRGKRIPQERYEEVARHYEEVGGASPFLRLTLAQAEALSALLGREGPPLPVYVGMRHWNPFLADTLAVMAGDGRRRAIGLVLATHRSPASWEAYLEAVEAGRRRVGESAPAVDYVAEWSTHPLFLQALAATTSEALGQVPEAGRGAARLVCTAHSIPLAMARRSGYDAGLRRTADLLGERLGMRPSLAYTSRSGDPADPWLEPDIDAALRALEKDGAREVVVSPIGFLSDHVEVLYDLDVAARRTAAGLGIGFFRARTAGAHPAFIRLMATLVRERAAEG